MIRMLRNLSLGLGAALALSAVGASAAMAVPQFTASSYPAQTTGTGISLVNTEAGWTECDLHVVGHHQPGSSSTLTLTKTLSNCEAFGFLSATVNTEGCSYLFHATEKVSSGVYKHHMDIVCPAGKSIKISAAGGLCKMEIKGQTGLTTIKTTNLAGGQVTVSPEVSGLAYTVTTDGFGCPFSGTGNKTDGKETGSVTVSRVGGGTVEVSGE
jgi:hypothetical protein